MVVSTSYSPRSYCIFTTSGFISETICKRRSEFLLSPFLTAPRYRVTLLLSWLGSLLTAAAAAAAAPLIATDTSTSDFLAIACTKFFVYLPTPPFIGGYSPETTKIFIPLSRGRSVYVYLASCLLDV